MTVASISPARDSAHVPGSQHPVERSRGLLAGGLDGLDVRRVSLPLDAQTRQTLRMLVSDKRRERAELLLADEYRPVDDCDQCGERFEPRPYGGGAPQRFCSSRCQKRWNQQAHRVRRNAQRKQVAA